MGNYHVLMQYDIEAKREALLQALTTVDGITSWWSPSVQGSTGAVGDRFGVGFPGVPAPFEFTVTRADEDRVEWKTGEMPPPWAGTSIRFDISENPDGPGLRLLFSHRDFDPENPVIAMVTPTWAQIVLRLKGYLESGEKQPFFPPAA